MKPAAPPSPAYPEAATKAFRLALTTLKGQLAEPEIDALGALLDEGRIHDAAAVEKVIAGGAQ